MSCYIVGDAVGTVVEGQPGGCESGDSPAATPMPIPRLRYQTLELGDFDIHLRTLRDRQQFSDDEGEAGGLGIGSASWPLFGVVWASGYALAREMLRYPIDGRRVLEVGCGIGLASIVLSLRRADITATDRHPEAEGFLQRNVELNGGPPIPFVRTAWDDEASALTDFDLIIGGDVLYERGHPDSLAGFIDRHARPTCEVLIADPGRHHTGRFSRRMFELGYGRGTFSALVADDDGDAADAAKVRLLRHARGAQDPPP